MKRILFLIFAVLGISINSFSQVYYEDINYDVQLGIGFSQSTNRYTLSIVQYDRDNFTDFSFVAGNSILEFERTEVIHYPDLDTRMVEFQYILTPYQHSRLINLLTHNEYVYINGIRYVSTSIMQALGKIVNFAITGNQINISVNNNYLIPRRPAMIIPRHPMHNGNWERFRSPVIIRNRYTNDQRPSNRINVNRDPINRNEPSRMENRNNHSNDFRRPNISDRSNGPVNRSAGVNNRVVNSSRR